MKDRDAATAVVGLDEAAIWSERVPGSPIPHGHPASWLTIEWARDVDARRAGELGEELARRISALDEVEIIHHKASLRRDAERADQSDRETLARKSLDEKWTAERQRLAGFEVEALAEALLASERELRIAHRAMDGYDKADLALARDRDVLADRLRQQLGRRINAEAELILRTLDATWDGDKPSGDAWAAALTVACGLIAGARTALVAEVAGLPVERIAPFAERLKQNGVWEAGKTCVDADLRNDGEFEVWFWLASLVAEGELVRLPAGSYQSAKEQG